MAKKKTHNPALIGIGSLLAIAIISIIAFNITPVPEPVPTDGVPLGFSTTIIIGLVLLVFGIWKKQKKK